MRTLTLGPSAASFAAVLVIVGIDPFSKELSMSLKAFIISMSLGVSGYMLISLQEETDSELVRRLLWVLGALTANIGHLALVTGIYFLIKHVSSGTAMLFLKIGGGVYLLFTLIYFGLQIWNFTRKSDV